MGYFLSHGDVDLDRGDYFVHLEEENTFFSVFTPSNSEYGAEVAGIPRVTADYFVLDELSLGASVGYAMHGGDFEIRSNIQTSGSDDFDDFDLYLAGARVGYMSMLMDGLGVWPRAAYQYSHWRFEDVDDETGAFGALHTLNFEASLVLLPSPSWGVQAGVVLDVSVSGNQTDVSTLRRAEFDVSRRTIGVTAGLTGFL